MDSSGKNFYFTMPTMYVFGDNAMTHLGERLEGCSRVVFIHGPHAVPKLGLDKDVHAIFDARNIAYSEFGKCGANPDEALVEHICDICQEFAPDLILAAGGGSVIDAAKAAALLYGMRREVGKDLRFYDAAQGFRDLKQALPVGVILTLPASGSECNNSFVISEGCSGKKIARAHRLASPAFAICDPKVIESLSKRQLACACSDIMAHLLEQLFCTQERLDPFDMLIYGSISSLIESWNNLDDETMTVQSRESIMILGSLGLSYLFSAGRSCDWVAHEIEHRLSGTLPGSHGHVLSLVMPAWVRAMAGNPYYQIHLQGLEDNCPYALRNGFSGLEVITRFYKGLNLPADDIRAAVWCNMDECVEKIMAGGRLGKCEGLTPELCRSVLQGL
ncbi:iron-containing alcohol dehydrogenase [Adlercreutzia sp. ZJ138]|uniref:iron-containing alcohol dehydrogenase n=1 Tax=Adlercreutzia sp. ZJ138 TaxID=2709405 RepID=UPI0013ECD77B|nr:iron-containing alcohol dehydrogenase [Adlercreutzia sp. ZJ138]